MTLKLYLLRHGETIQNNEQIIQGHQPGKLNKTGICQADLLARRLSGLHFSRIMCSDLTRARETLDPLLRLMPDSFVEYREDLRERNLGEFQGMKRHDIGYSKMEINNFHNPRNGESLQELFQRAGRLLDEFKSLNAEYSLAMSHGGLIKAMVGVVLGKTANDFYDIETIRNTSVTILEKNEEENFRISLLNCVSHLE